MQRQRSNRVELLTDDERAALEAGYGCATCLDFGDLPGLGPCPVCQPDEAAEHLIAEATAMQVAIWNEEHDWEAWA